MLNFGGCSQNGNTMLRTALHSNQRPQNPARIATLTVVKAGLPLIYHQQI